ncbi:MAG: hypothetical protein Ta2E_10460 [Mycoplasmoidaceae bacterium]|nr:MAG: hypothetical protein Ta2E_10460 [Mycoplasmoidaceae bacterium]
MNSFNGNWLELFRKLTKEYPFESMKCGIAFCFKVKYT